jgi:hypothetical protein
MRTDRRTHRQTYYQPIRCSSLTLGREELLISMMRSFILCRPILGRSDQEGEEGRGRGIDTLERSEVLTKLKPVNWMRRGQLGDIEGLILKWILRNY